MKDFLKIIGGTALFRDIGQEELETLARDMAITVKSYEKSEIIIMAGNKIKAVGILIEGGGQITRENMDGTRSILSELEQGDLFGESYAAAETTEVPVTVLAATDCKVAWIPYAQIISRAILAHNMIRVIAQKNVWMNEKMRLVSCKTTREKLMTYLGGFSERAGKRKFEIPFDRNELADYLAVDRSAMSRELGKLRNEGIIAFRKNTFELL